MVDTIKLNEKLQGTAHDKRCQRRIYKHGTGHVFKCLGWPCAATFFCETPIVTLVSLLPETHTVATELDIVNGSLCNLCPLTRGLALHIRQ